MDNPFLLQKIIGMDLIRRTQSATFPKGEGKKIVKKETDMDVLSIVKLDVIDGKVVIESTIED